jgi:release factor glutamine methyltransferase
MTAVDSIEDTLHAAVRTLAGHSDSPRLDAEVLLCKILGVSRSALIARGTDSVAAASRHAYDGLIARRLQGAPVAYLTGMREFWSLPLIVTPDVLVPRPETELLVEHVLRLLPENADRRVLDLGTGSGAIALAIASERPRAHLTGVDVSHTALAVARANSLELGLPQIEWRLGSWFEAVRGERFDAIAANPPYVAINDPAMQRLAAEPVLALAPGPTGLEALSSIIGEAAAHLNPQGWLLLEHGSTQAAEVAAMLERSGFVHISSHADYSGKPRVTLGTVHTSH